MEEKLELGFARRMTRERIVISDACSISIDICLRTRLAWTAVTHALGGLFCAGLGSNEDGDSITNFGGIYPPHGKNTTGESTVHHSKQYPSFIHHEGLYCRVDITSQD